MDWRPEVQTGIFAEVFRAPSREEPGPVSSATGLECPLRWARMVGSLVAGLRDVVFMAVGSGGWEESVKFFLRAGLRQMLH